MNVLFAVAGVAVLVFVIVDLLWTTLWVDGGAGPLSARLAARVWNGLGLVSRGNSRVLSLAGPLILAATLATWVGLIWVGWTLLFAGDESALVSTHTGDPADWAGRAYYVAYTMFTNGNGDYTPTGSGWEIASALTTASGMLFVTLGVSYVLSVLGAVSEKRSFASSVTGLGDDAEALVRTSWHEEDFDGLDLPLESLAAQLTLLAEQHEAYPILHYYHSEEGDQASAVAVPIFDESLTLFRYGIPTEDQPEPVLIENARSSAESYLETLDSAFIEPAPDVPPPPDLDRLREADVPTVSDDEFGDALEDLTERRRTLLGVVEADAWHWPPLEA